MDRSTRKIVLAGLAAAVLIGALTQMTLALFQSTTATPGTFQAANSFGPTCTAYAPWVEGMETSIAVTPLMFTSSLGAVTLDSTVKRTGAYSVKIIKGANSIGQIRRGGVGGNTIVWNFGLRLAALPSGDSTLAWLDRGGLDLTLKYKASTQKLTLQWGANPATEANVVFTAATWHQIEIKADASAAAVSANWRLDGSEQPAATGTDTGAAIAGPINSFYLGTTTTSEAPAYTANYDDLLVTKVLSDYPIGDTFVRAMRPNVNGTHVNPNHFENHDGSPTVVITPIDSTSWNRLDDATLFGGTDSLVQNAAGASSYLEFGFDNPPDGACVLGVSGWVTVGSIGSSGNSVKESVFDGSTETVLHSGATGCGNCVSARGGMLTPAATPWTEQRVDDLVIRLGYQQSATPQTRWGHAMLQYATTVP